MVRQILPISALLLGSFFLLFAGGINGLILPVRGTYEGFSAFSLGLLGTGWAVGYVSGCLFTARLVGRVGHIRAFSVMSSFAGIAVLAELLLLSPETWIVLRGFQGFCFAGAAMIVESWLGERATPATRGRVFGIYTMVNLTASTGGQMILTLGEVAGYQFFVLAAMFYMLALVPTAMTSSTTPRPLVSVQIDLRALWRNSPVAVFAVFMVGVSNAAFGVMAAVYAARIGMPVPSIALFTSIPVLAGALAQIPVGILSDRIDRRKVLIGTAAVALCGDAAFLILRPEVDRPEHRAVRPGRRGDLFDVSDHRGACERQRHRKFDSDFGWASDGVRPGVDRGAAGRGLRDVGGVGDRAVHGDGRRACASGGAGDLPDRPPGLAADRGEGRLPVFGECAGRDARGDRSCGERQRVFRGQGRPRSAPDG